MIKLALTKSVAGQPAIPHELAGFANRETSPIGSLCQSGIFANRQGLLGDVQRLVIVGDGEAAREGQA